MVSDSKTDLSSTERKLEFSAGFEPVPGYRLIEQLGRGGFGEVWKALGPGDVPVALKRVSLEGSGKVEERAMEVIKAIRHPHLLPVFGIWRIGDVLIVAMELADRTLLDRYKEAVGQGFPGIPAPEIHEHFSDAARGLDYLNEPRHAAGSDQGPMAVQHRDIKPQNILLVGGCSKVADFGLARVLEGSTSGHSGGMTPTYAAPEFFEGRTSSQSDQYSLAVAYCHLRGGRPPFTGTIQEVMMGHVSQPPDLSMLPENERPAVARALSKKPKDRWPNCRAFIEAMKPDKPSATVTYRQEDTIPLGGRRKLLLIAISLMVLVIAGTAIGKFWPRSSPATPVNGDSETGEQHASKTSDPIGESGDPDPKTGPVPSQPPTWALEFDGVDDVVRTHYLYRGIYPVTFEAVLTPGSSLQGAIVGSILVGEKRGTGRGIGLAFGRNGSLAMLVRFNEHNWNALAQAPVLPNQRIHVAGRYDPRTRRVDLFVNGVLQGGAGPTEETGAFRAPILIGDDYSRAPGPDRSYLGQIEWVRVSSSLRHYDGKPVPFQRPQADGNTMFLVDFTKGENHPPVIVPPRGEVEIDGPRWVQVKQ